MKRNVYEAEVNKSDVNGIFKLAASLRDEPQGKISKFFRRQAKDKVDVADLQQAWQKEGYPDDIRDIEHILKSFGFGDDEIHKVFARAFGDDDNGDYNTPEASPAIMKIAQYAKKAGIDKDLIAFMQREYGFKESTEFSGKVMIEDVRRIFAEIVNEERSALPKMIMDAEKTTLGRNRNK